MVGSQPSKLTIAGSNPVACFITSGVVMSEKLHNLDIENKQYKVTVDRCSGLPIVKLRICNLECNIYGDQLTAEEILMRRIFGQEQISLTPDHAREIANALLEHAKHCEEHPECPEFKERREKREKVV